MTHRRRILVSAVTLATLAGAAFLATASPNAPAAPATPLDLALEKRASGKASPNDVEIDASWQLPEGHRSAQIWGDGVGIWNDSVQFRLSHEQVLSIVKMLADARVGAMPQPGAKAPAPSGKTPKAPLQMRGEITVIVGDVRTHRQQLTKGEQSQALADLVTRILEISQKASSVDGVRASSLQDGLAKVAAGTLAPQTFTASVRRQSTEKEEGESVPEGWLLRIDGRHASDRLMPKGQIPPPPRELVLSEADFRKLVEGVQANDPTGLPNNTYSPAYTEVTVAVLDYRKNVPARPYLDVTAETHGEKQKSFDRLYALFRSIHEEVQKQGASAKPAAVAPSVPKH